MPDRWWTTFGDTALDKHVERSLGGSFTLAAAWQRVRAARALAVRESSDLWPKLNAFGDAEGFFRSSGPEESLFALGLDAAYEVDLWGRIESHADAVRYAANATEFDYQTVALTLSAEMARTWYSLIEARAQLALLEEQLETNLTGQQLQEARFARGLIRSPDVLRQRALVESTREQMVIARSRVELLEHQFAVLQGQPPQAASYPSGTDLPSLPPLPATGLPSELLQRRPDVRRDYYALWAADRELASAVSNQYPRISLTASITTAAESPENLFRDWIAVTAGQFIAPILDGWQRRAQVNIEAADLRELHAVYGQTVLEAFRDVEDALALERYRRERIESLNKQVDLARQSSQQLREQYLIGETEYLDVLTAITQEQRLQREILSARLDVILARISLYVALAGSFDSCPQFVSKSLPPDRILHEPPEPTLSSPLDPPADHRDRLRRDSERLRGGDRGDQPDGADGAAD